MDLKKVSLRILDGQIKAQEKKGDKKDPDYFAKLLEEKSRRMLTAKNLASNK